MKLPAFLRQFNGPLTEQLVLEPGSFHLGQVPAHHQADAVQHSICGYCSTGCSLKIHQRENQPVNLSPDNAYPVNQGMACPKGWEALSPLKATNRATQPLLRDAAGILQPVSWHKALQVFVERFKQIQSNEGPDALAFLSTGQIPSEEMALLGALAKFGMGIRHGDGNTRQCMATAVVAYKQSFGFDAPPYTYQDFEASEVIVFIGANPCIAHPIMWQRVMQNPNHPEIIVIDPRKTETAMAATLHLPLAPKSDLALFYGIAHLLIEHQAIDRSFIESHTSGFSDFLHFINDCTLDKTVEQSGLSAESILTLVDLIASGKRTSFWWTMGVNQSHEGVRVAQAIINIALMTGNIGKPGTGANSITGQCNAMGSRLFSNTTSLLGGHEFTNPDHRQKVAQCLDLPLETIPSENCWAYDQIIAGIEADQVKGLWVIATNPAHSWTNRNKLKKIREQLDFLVVQDMYMDTETAQIADLVLPAAGWGEKEGTFINSERRIGVLHKVSRAPGQALADFYIFKAIAHQWGCADRFTRWESPEATFKLLAQLTQDRPCDISAIEGYDQIEARGGIQWPYANPSIDGSQERRLFEDGRFYTADEKARFCFEAIQPLPESPSEAYPFWLLTGRGTSSQWHTQTRTGNSDVLRKLYPQDCYVEINQLDALSRGIRSGDVLHVRTERGSIKADAYVSPSVPPGILFLPMHYDGVNELTLDTFDPYSRQPSYKANAASIDKN